jgi:pantothenate kinase
VGKRKFWHSGHLQSADSPSDVSTFCTALLHELEARHPSQVAFVPMDGFHYTRAQLDAFPDPKDAHYRRGAVDTFDADAWAELVHRLRDMRREETIDVPGFDHAVKDPEEGKIQIPGSSRIILFEGNYLMVSHMHSSYIPISYRDRLASSRTMGDRCAIVRRAHTDRYAEGRHRKSSRKAEFRGGDLSHIRRNVGAR